MQGGGEEGEGRGDGLPGMGVQGRGVEAVGVHGGKVVAGVEEVQGVGGGGSGAWGKGVQGVGGGGAGPWGRSRGGVYRGCGTAAGHRDGTHASGKLVVLCPVANGASGQPTCPSS